MSQILTRIAAALAEKYAVERELGAGGMATVFLARDIRHDREVAIKVLHPDLGASIGGERFEREIRVAGRLQHPHILGMYDSGSADGLLYYVMPFVKGESLRDRIDREGQLPLDDALQITLEVADALGHAHEQGIIHRDIKPENILLQGGHAMVADFGIARAAEEGQKLTQTGMSIGTPAYMAPEQGMGEKVGPTADIYALGCVLFEMLAGEPPFSGKTSSAILAKHVMEQVPSLRIIRQSVPEEIELAIFAALGKSPADRPQSCAAFAEMLVAAPSGHTSTRLMTMRHTAARRTGMQTSAFGITAPAPAPLWRRPLVVASAVAVVILGALAGWLATRGGPSLAAVGGLDARRIAVLYFEDRSPDDALADLADGITESLIDALGQVSDLTVISRGGVEPWRDVTNVGADSIARALDVGVIVRGSVEPRGDRVRVAVRLVDGNSGIDLGDTRTLELAATDVTAIRDSTAQEVATIIREELGQQVRLANSRQGTGNTEAWLLLQRAERLRRTATGVPAGEAMPMLARADTMLANAERLDGDWIDPVTARAAVAYDESRKAGLDPIQARGAIARGLEHADRALAIDPRDPEALEVRGNLRYWSWLLGLEPDPARATELINAARADYDQSQTAGAYASLSHLLYNVPDAGLSDIIIAAQRAYEKDAFLANAETILSRLFLANYEQEQWVQAERWCDEMQRRFPASFQAPRCQLFLQTSRAVPQPDVARAWRLADSTAALAPESRKEFQRLNSDLLVAAVLARAGLADSARAVVGRSRGNPTIDPSADLAQFAAFVRVLLGDTTEALAALRDYLAATPRRREALASDAGWWYRPIKDTPEFQALVSSGR